MSQENVEAVRAIYERFAEGDFRATVDLLDRHVRFLMLADDPELEEGWGTADRLYIGVEGVASGMRRLFEVWADLTMEAEELSAVGDAVLVTVRHRGVDRRRPARWSRGRVRRSGGVPTEYHYFTLWSFRGGKVIRIENFRERGQAVEAARLSE